MALYFGWGDAFLPGTVRNAHTGPLMPAIPLENQQGRAAVTRKGSPFFIFVVRMRWRLLILHVS